MIEIRNDIEKIVNELLESDKHITISFAESLTGGLLSSTLTKIPGVSKIFSGSIVAYSNECKVNILNVPLDVILKNGAVSKECAYHMAKGLFNITGSNISISATGVAGPSLEENKPIGLVFIGFIINGIEPHVFEKHFKGSRIEIQNQVTNFVFEKIKEYSKTL